MKFIAYLFCAFLLSGCFYHNVQNYGQIDQNQKTVTVPPGAGGIKGDIKKVLSELGWRQSIDRGPSVTEGKIDKKTKLESYDTFNTRYRLYVKSFQYDMCWNGSPAINYDISFIDNNSGSEIFTLEGRGCQSGVVEKFRDAILGVSK
jgi:hypothetical protein